MSRRERRPMVHDPFTDPTRSEEWRTFLLLTIVLAPVMTVACIGGYGFLVWMAQLIFGPPTH